MDYINWSIPADKNRQKSINAATVFKDFYVSLYLDGAGSNVAFYLPVTVNKTIAQLGVRNRHLPAALFLQNSGII